MMMPGLVQIIGVLGVWTLLGWGSVFAAELSPPNSVPLLEEKVGFSEEVPTVPFFHLRDIIRRFSKRTGIPIRLSQQLQVDGEALSKLYSARDDSWLEEFSRVEVLNQQTGRKEIILLKSHSLDSLGGPHRKTGASPIPFGTRTASPKIPTGRLGAPGHVEGRNITLSLEKLQKLVKGPYRSPLPVDMYEDPEYRAFFNQFGVRSALDLRNRKKAKKIRKEARKRLYQMKAKAK